MNSAAISFLESSVAGTALAWSYLCTNPAMVAETDPQAPRLGLERSFLPQGRRAKLPNTPRPRTAPVASSTPQATDKAGNCPCLQANKSPVETGAAPG
jgi:hypothetical protein